MYNVTFHVDFLEQSQRSLLGSAKLTINLPFVPTTDINFEHSVWKDSKKPISVSYNLDDSSFFVCFKTDYCTEDSITTHKEMYKGHGWDIT